MEKGIQYGKRYSIWKKVFNMEVWLSFATF